jgi:hypothetical protein
MRHPSDLFRGGALELSRTMADQTKAEPERFLKLATRFDKDTNPLYLDGILDGLAGAEPITNLVEVESLLQEAHGLEGRPCTRSICRLVEHYADQPLSEVTLRIVGECATTSADPTSDIWKVDAGGGQPYYGGDMLTSGMNSDRGAGAIAISALLAKRPQRLALLRDALRSLVSDPVIAVRACALGCLRAILPVTPDDAIDLFLISIQDQDALLATREAGRFMMQANRSRFAQLRPTAERMLHSKNDALALAGAEIICMAALELDEAHGLAQACIAAGAVAPRLGAARIFAANAHYAPARELSEKALLQFFGDLDPEVRKAASWAFESSREGTTDLFRRLGPTYVMSEAFADNSFAFLHALEVCPELPVALVADLASRTLELAGDALTDIQTRWSGEGRTVFSLVVRALAANPDEERRVRLLDVADKFFELEAHDPALVAEFDR